MLMDIDSVVDGSCFDVTIMRALVEKDMFLKSVYESMKPKSEDENRLLEVLYKTYVCDDMAMGHLYSSIGSCVEST